MKEITILRLDHRQHRDQRMTTHLALISRALGVKNMLYTGERDTNLENSLDDVVKRWGGSFTINYIPGAKSFISNWKGITIHLTMYGEKHHETIQDIKLLEDPILIIVGGTKVPGYIYDIADFNTAVGWQPQSEAGAIAIFIHELLGSEMLYARYPNSSINIEGTGFKAERSERFKS
ncbi:MAG: tRNA (cytidine(56)-2'-O)-methyltransferase [Candidatus Heimdallarchaeota archaeon]|nr:tRNA (cytidine(56)-2'-O)-methyltransferase [Candidatus Heimdallarchaeota archaeon]MDH5646259.1 tRNA (cytidine(56)-2'-O)-methyltransferase [Candidatus Heimdallarchaeota archaeon]